MKSREKHINIKSTRKPQNISFMFWFYITVNLITFGLYTVGNTEKEVNMGNCTVSSGNLKGKKHITSKTTKVHINKLFLQTDC